MLTRRPEQSSDQIRTRRRRLERDLEIDEPPAWARESSAFYGILFRHEDGRLMRPCERRRVEHRVIRQGALLDGEAGGAQRREVRLRVTDSGQRVHALAPEFRKRAPSTVEEIDRRPQ
jgi:hypothetical protein